MENTEDLEGKIEQLRKKLATQKAAYARLSLKAGAYYDAKIMQRSAMNTEDELRETMRRLGLLQK